MATSAVVVQSPEDPLHLSSQDVVSVRQRAIDNAQAAIAKLPIDLSQQCSNGDTVSELVDILVTKYGSQKKRGKLARKFKQYSAWLVNFSNVVDVIVQTQAGIACPIWAPLKFALQLSEFHSEVVEHVVSLIETISNGVPRFSIYEQLNDETVLQTALINIYTCIIEYCSSIIQYLNRGRIRKLFDIAATKLKKDLADYKTRLKKLSQDADNAAVATELLRASKARDEMARKQTEDLRIRATSWLRPSNQEEVLQGLAHEILPGTCEWILHYPKFIEWQSGSGANRLLCISGKHGCGKSVLASSVTQSSRASDEHVLFFSFSSMDSSRQTHSDLARSFIWQSLQVLSYKGIDVIQDLILQNRSSSSNLWDAFTQISSRQKMVWVIDGLDECRQPSSESFSLIYDLLALHQNSRVLIFGRPSAFQSFISANTIEVTPEATKSDIEAFIQSEVSQCRNLRSAEIQALTQQTLRTNSDGMFLWVKLAVHDLNKPASNSVLKERLRHLPYGLIQTYQHLLLSLVRAMDDTDRRLLHIILSLVVAARRPMKLEELQYAEALADWSSQECPGPFVLYEYAVTDFARHLRDLCGNLITISGNIVSLAHISVKEYLIRHESEWMNSDDRYLLCLRVDFCHANHLLFYICIKFWEISKPDLDTVECPFLGYGCENLLFHFNQSSRLNESILQVRQFFGSSTYLIWVEYYQAHILFSNSGSVCIEDFGEFFCWSEGSMQTTDLHQKLHQAYEHWLEGPRDLFQDDAPAEYSVERLDDDVLIPAAGRLSIRGSTQEEMMQTLIQNGSLALKLPQFTFSLIRKILGVKTLSDPLELLFQAIIRTQVPTPVLLGVGKFYRRLGRPDKALEVFQVAARKSSYRDYWGFIAHFNVVKTLRWPLQRLPEAEDWCCHLLPGCQNILEAPTTYWTRKMLSKVAVYQLENHGFVLYDREKYNDAEKIFHLWMLHSTAVFGKDHENAIEAMFNLGCALTRQEKYSDAAIIFRRTLEAMENTLGEKNEDMLLCMRWSGCNLYYQGRYDEAAKFFSRVLHIKKESSEANQSLQKDMLYYGRILLSQKKYIEARKILSDTVECMKETLGNDHKDTLWSIYWLDKALSKQARYAETDETFSI